jgi:hypothetical protein
MVNLHFAVYSKLGVQTQAPRAINQLWSTVAGACSTNNDGDPIVLYDQLADRWLLSQFIASGTPYYGECIAVSVTGDPAGAYYLYTFNFGTSTFHDYPHLGMWPGAYFMTTNEFDSGPSGQTSRGAGVFAFRREQMLVGTPNPQFVYFDLGPDNPSGPNSPQAQFIGQQPADLDGTALPPDPFTGYITEVDDESNIPTAGGVTGDAMRIWRFHVDWASPSSSTLGQDEAVVTGGCSDPMSATCRHHQPNYPCRCRSSSRPCACTATARRITAIRRRTPPSCSTRSATASCSGRRIASSATTRR